MDTKSIEREAARHRKYAAKHNCSLIQAIADRDWPLTRTEIADLLRALEIEPTPSNVSACHPHNEEQVRAFVFDDDDRAY